jgi:nucleoside-diphosphate-sugar epimerase
MGGRAVKLFVLGIGYSSRAFIDLMRPELGAVGGTVRSQGKADALAGQGIAARVFDGSAVDPAILSQIAAADALLVSIPPGPSGDPALPLLGEAVAAARHLRWIGYLSTIGVYGDRGGAWVTEEDEVRPSSERSVARVAAEQGWLELGARADKPVAILRLAGIYGPGQNALVNLRQGTAKRLVKPGQVFNRIHVEDIARAAAASLAKPVNGRVYNVTDDEPAPPQDVVTYAAALMGIEPPPETDFARAELSPMARSFYSENKRVSNARLRTELGFVPRYPTYREGIRALWEAGDGRA